MSHSAHKVSVCGGNTSLTLSENAHITAKAGTTGRSAHDCASLNEGSKKSLFHRLQINALRCGDHDAADALLHLAALQNLGCNAQIINSSVRAGTDDNLIDDDGIHRMNFIDRMRILRQMREGNRRP